MKKPKPMGGKKAAPPVAGAAGGIIASKGPIAGAVMKGMGHTKPASTPLLTDRGAFKLKG